ncbi:hypothetical protein Lal_00028099 [Lupinus albus]|uniref:Mitochondrial inner membrane protease ATP23 n=1 Tax=Lupinus albus TaxID=3870 RepID=A0A6A4NE14_LUPAL|nr:putative peptidase M76, ATP23 [Lupinus albus]KAF1859916.1 hypothetical protein Lal_00028099 [Lupinus albus]
MAAKRTSPPTTTVKECQTMIQITLQNPTVKFLRQQMEKAGCPVPDSFFRAAYCPLHRAAQGAFMRGKGVFVCSNYTVLQEQVDRVIIHELIHAFDDCRAKINWNNCAHHACSEIRAGHLSGDCHFKRELLRGFLKLRGQGQECVRRRVMESLSANPNCGGSVAKDSMEAVWDICYNDTKPFDRAP